VNLEQLRSLLSHRKFRRSDLNSLLALKTKILFRGRGEVIEDLGAGPRGSTREKMFNFQFSKSELKLKKKPWWRF